MNKTSDVLSRAKFFVYTLFSLKDKNLYTGRSEQLKYRIEEHFKGGSISTKFRRPFVLVHYESFINKKDAIAREVFLKSGFGRKQLKFALKRTLADLILK